MRYLVLAPDVLVAATALGVIVAGRLGLAPAASRLYLPLVTTTLVVVALGVELSAGAALNTYFGGALVQDRFALFAKAAALAIAAVAVATTDWASEDSLHLGLAMPLLAAFGVMVAASAADMLGLWAGLELAAAAAVVMIALRRPDLGLRLLVVGGVATSLVLAGLAFLYASTGNADLGAIHDVLASRAPTVALAVPMLLLLAGLALRAGLAPFHVGQLPIGLGASPLGAGVLIGLVALAAATVGVKLVAVLAPVPSIYAPYGQVVAAVAMVGGGAAALAV
ncbi:MAG TPA: proton-conducting transporter membrane subunit, partial [Methylomirabilota bacterium]|nr:proton-conducting transporter membrane subunit [Methylomirabilota bacterium]